MGEEFPQDLTDDEADLGFQVQEIDNPAGQAATPPMKVRAVVFQVEDWERVVKVRDPGSGRVLYRRQVHGVWEPTVPGDTPTWKACGEHADPKAALAPEARQADRARSVDRLLAPGHFPGTRRLRGTGVPPPGLTAVLVARRRSP